MNRKEQHIIDELKKAPTPLPSDDYFRQLRTEMLSKLPESGRKIVPLYKKWWAVSSAAASVILVIGLFFLQNETATTKTVQAGPDWNSINKDDVIAYIEENIDDFEPETLAAQLTNLPEWELSLPATKNRKALSAKVKKEEKSTDALFDELDDKEILDYLRDEASELDDELLIGY